MGLLKKKSLWLSALFLLILGGATVYVVYKELKGQDILGTLRNADIRWVLAAVLSMAVYALPIGPAVTREQSPAFLRNSNGRLDFPGPTQEAS